MYQSSYSRLERWLHWVALEPSCVGRVAFQLERHFALPAADSSPAGTVPTGWSDGAVYVCGLARAGTTLLLRILGQVSAFRSLTYRDMPFVLAPNLWDGIVRHAKRHMAPAPRVHGDGVLIDFDSPEAFEEVFWRLWDPASSACDCIGGQATSAAAWQAFADYRAIVANPRCARAATQGLRRRYLSKNNNNLSRLRQLCADDSATVLLMYRRPLDAARSLFSQHQRLSRLQAQDRFVRSYMKWLGHHEFGLDHKPFCFATAALDASLRPDHPSYWLDYWTIVHTHLLAQQGLRIHLVSYDELCERPQAMLQSIFQLLGVATAPGSLAAQISRSTASHPPADHPEGLVERAADVYDRLRSSSRNVERASPPQYRLHRYPSNHG